MTIFMPERTSWSMPSVLTTVGGGLWANPTGVIAQTERLSTTVMSSERTINSSPFRGDIELVNGWKPGRQFVRMPHRLKRAGTSFRPQECGSAKILQSAKDRQFGATGRVCNDPRPRLLGRGGSGERLDDLGQHIGLGAIPLQVRIALAAGVVDPVRRVVVAVFEQQLDGMGLRGLQRVAEHLFREALPVDRSDFHPRTDARLCGRRVRHDVGNRSLFAD